MTVQNAARLAVVGFALVAVAGVLLRPLTPIDETRYLAVAWEMYQNGNYFVPTKNFELYTQKPPLLFWTINLVWMLVGVSETAARLVGPAYAVASLLLTGLLARRLWPEDAGIGSRTILALSGLMIFSVLGGLTMFDAMLTTATLIGLLALFEWGRTGALRWCLLLGFAIAFGVLAKGPVILIHLAPAMLTLPLWAAAPDEFSARRMLKGIGLALGVALILIAFWLLPAILIGGAEYRDAILWKQSAGRISNSFAHKRPIWFFAALLPLYLFPWIWLPAFWRRLIRLDGGDRALRLCLIWFASAFVLFSLISGKQPHYLVPELPAFALIATRLLSGETRFNLTLATVPVFAVAAAALAGAVGVLKLGEVATLLSPFPVLIGWALLVAALSLLCIRIGGLYGVAVLSLGLVLSINLLIGLADMREIYSTQGLGRLVAPHEQDGIAFHGQDFHAEFNFAARLTRPVALPETEADIRDWSLQHPNGVIVARPDRASIPWSPQETVLFRNATYAIWHVADAKYAELNP